MALQVGVGLVVAPARERDLAGVPAKVVAALGQDADQLTVIVDVQGDEDGGIGPAADVERDRVLGAEQNAGQRLAKGGW